MAGRCLVSLKLGSGYYAGWDVQLDRGYSVSENIVWIMRGCEVFWEIKAIGGISGLSIG